MFQISWLPLNTFNVTLINRSVYNLEFSSVQTLSCVWLFATPWITAGQASLSISNSLSSLKLMSIESVMPSSHLIVSCPLLLLPPIPPSIRVFSNESTLCMRWPKDWSFSFSIIPSKEHPRLIQWVLMQGRRAEKEKAESIYLYRANIPGVSYWVQ